MEKVVVDTSIAVKWFIEEDGSDKAIKILQQHQQGKIILIAPDILLLELINALYYKKLQQQDINTALKLIYKLELQFISLSLLLITQASKITSRFQIASYDSLFIVVAKELDCFLITADRKHHRKEIYKKIKYL